jgi:rhamnogalacturonyl hydrolase YesR
MRKRAWVKDRNIVDTGFTAGLFARLYEITGKKEYRTFLKRFSSKYIDVFYIKSENCFSTAIDGNDKQYGGAFGRGQGWALEGLIPAYRVLRDEEIRTVIRDTIETLLRLQTADGAWAYNLMKPLMGEDCKGVPVIARCLLEWNDIEKDERLITAAQKALNWCVKHTASDSIAEGGIFSYTIEGAVVHHMYTNTAFTYGSSYALEVAHKLKGY